MSRLELGTKCICTGCHERFYDLNRSPAICPKCGAQQPPERPRVPRAQRPTSGTGLQLRQSSAAVTIGDDVEPVRTSEVEDERDLPQRNDEGDDDIEIDPGLDKAAD